VFVNGTRISASFWFLSSQRSTFENEAAATILNRFAIRFKLGVVSRIWNRVSRRFRALLLRTLVDFCVGGVGDGLCRS
jgi:hypothetical protein